MVDLTYCNHVSPLGDENYHGYFSSMRSDTIPWKVNELMDYLSRKLPGIQACADAEQLIERSTFVQYHTAASSTPGLIERALDSSPFGNVMFEGEIAAYTRARRDLTNLSLERDIPPRVLVITSVILESCNQLPSNWYMGKKAVDAFSAAKNSALRKIVARGLTIANDAQGGYRRSSYY